MADSAELEVRLADLPMVIAIFEATVELVAAITADFDSMPPAVLARLRPRIARITELAGALERETK